MGTIYILKNKVDGKVYIGKTERTFDKRLIEHYKADSYIGNALRKYGSDNFEQILIENISDNILSDEEIRYIKEYDCVSPKGYNLTYGGDGMIPSDETRKKLSDAKKGQIPWMKGKHHTDETKQKLSDSLMGRESPRKGATLSDETKQKISDSLTGLMIGELNPFFGKTHSEESNQKNREAHLGLPSAFKGKHHTDEAKQILSEKHKGLPSPMKGRTHTEEANEKNRLAHLGKIPPNKGIRVPHLCKCGLPVKEKMYNGVFKGYQKTCGKH